MRFWSCLEIALKESNLEPRTGLLSVLILCISTYSFRMDVALAVILLTLAFNPKKTLAGLFASTPFVAFFVFVSLILGGLEKIPTVVAFVCIGCLLYGIQPEDFGYALMYFRIPPKFAHSITIAMRMFQILIRDLRLTSEALKLSETRGFGYYVKILKALSAIAVLRAFAIAETLYSRRFDFNKRVVRCKKPKLRDWILLVFSILILCYTYLTRNVL